jgi:hypothetical protein
MDQVASVMSGLKRGKKTKTVRYRIAQKMAMFWSTRQPHYPKHRTISCRGVRRFLEAVTVEGWRFLGLEISTRRDSKNAECGGSRQERANSKNRGLFHTKDEKGKVMNHPQGETLSQSLK